MRETVKEQIKRKKKEQAEALLNNNEEPKTTADPDVNSQSEKPVSQSVDGLLLKADGAKMPIEVLGIYPINKPKKNFIAQGSVKIKLHKIGLEIRNIPYAVFSGTNVRIQPPFRYYRFPDDPDKNDEYVESIAFDDASLWKAACKVIRAAVLEHHKEGLSKAEQGKSENSKEEKPESPDKVDATSDSTKD